MMSEGNGKWDKLDEIHQDLVDIELRLGDKIADSVNNLAATIDDFKNTINKHYAKTSRKLDIDVVAMMFGVLVLSITGVQAVEWLFKLYLAK